LNLRSRQSQFYHGWTRLLPAFYQKSEAGVDFRSASLFTPETSHDSLLFGGKLFFPSLHSLVPSGLPDIAISSVSCQLPPVDSFLFAPGVPVHSLAVSHTVTPFLGAVYFHSIGAFITIDPPIFFHALGQASSLKFAIVQFRPIYPTHKDLAPVMRFHLGIA